MSFITTFTIFVANQVNTQMREMRFIAMHFIASTPEIKCKLTNSDSVPRMLYLVRFRLWSKPLVPAEPDSCVRPLASLAALGPLRIMSGF